MYMLVQEAAQPLGPWAWLIQYLPVVGWPTVIGVLITATWKLSSIVTKIEGRATSAEKSLDAVIASNKELKDILEAQVGAQKELAQGVHQLADAIHHQSDMHAEQQGLIRDMVTEQKMLAQNQTVIMNGFQTVVMQLINAVKDKE